jgi:hypothetical protein
MIGKILDGNNPNRMLRSKSRFTWINPPEKFPEYSILFRERERERERDMTVLATFYIL